MPVLTSVTIREVFKMFHKKPINLECSPSGSFNGSAPPAMVIASGHPPVHSKYDSVEQCPFQQRKTYQPLLIRARAVDAHQAIRSVNHR